MKPGVQLIADERARQIGMEGYSADHDFSHDMGEMAMAAACYAMPAAHRDSVIRDWPWHLSEWKPAPGDRVRELVKAGALIAAEIDRLQRPPT